MTSGHVDEVLRLFDVKAAGWAEKYAPDGPLVGRLVRLSAAVTSFARAGDRVLDLGCGTGELARALAIGGLEVTGCDISPQMLLRAANFGAIPDRIIQNRTVQDRAIQDRTIQDGAAEPQWVRLEPDWRSLPFASGWFDVMVVSSVLEYVPEPVSVLRECARVLRPGGVLLYTVPDVRHPIRWVEWWARPVARMIGEPPAQEHRSRWQGYRAYLRASRQRHRGSWWLTASGAAGLDPVPYPAGRTRSPLRLLAFRAATRGNHA